ncbi:hypothetical protein DEU56DRAFT_985179 [Suillus clintonianus]|uniref:uncharacterized protein n=1 Tax=Suillus clintonianus TaxID=1904413 RepID=UPI001B85C326|nr:uncharacterized protein DEU56DRAFT_985179 [Suillus clintonianus]KAG2113972.1 hypothetical protein DEU56DRAFT_985179 [Suillus clintonianus]
MSLLFSSPRTYYTVPYPNNGPTYCASVTFSSNETPTKCRIYALVAIKSIVLECFARLEMNFAPDENLDDIARYLLMSRSDIPDLLSMYLSFSRDIKHALLNSNIIVLVAMLSTLAIFIESLCIWLTGIATSHIIVRVSTGYVARN